MKSLFFEVTIHIFGGSALFTPERIHAYQRLTTKQFCPLLDWWKNVVNQNPYKKVFWWNMNILENHNGGDSECKMGNFCWGQKTLKMVCWDIFQAGQKSMTRRDLKSRLMEARREKRPKASLATAFWRETFVPRNVNTTWSLFTFSRHSLWLFESLQTPTLGAIEKW